MFYLIRKPSRQPAQSDQMCVIGSYLYRGDAEQARRTLSTDRYHIAIVEEVN